jgi:hypothetical protein
MQKENYWFVFDGPVVREYRVFRSFRPVFINALVENFSYRLEAEIQPNILHEIHKGSQTKDIICYLARN